MDSVFRALADPSRRTLLDALREEDGRTLSELESRLAMSRFGVAKHLKALEAAGLVNRVRRGRFTHHYLDAVPLAEALARWIELYRVAPAIRGVLDRKARLEAPMDDKPGFVLSTYIRRTQDALWDALTDPEQMARCHFLAETVTREGDRYDYHLLGGREMLVCRTLHAGPKRRIEATFEPRWERGGGPSRSVFLVRPEGDHCALTVEHYDLTFPVVQDEGIVDGWARWAAGLKTFLENGEGMRFAEAAE